MITLDSVKTKTQVPQRYRIIIVESSTTESLTVQWTIKIQGHLKDIINIISESWSCTNIHV